MTWCLQMASVRSRYRALGTYREKEQPGVLPSFHLRAQSQQ